MAGINHSVVVTTGQKGLAADWNADHEVTGNVDVAKNQLLSMAIENRTDYPAGPVAGQVIYRTDTGEAFVWDGTGWHSLGKRTQYWQMTGSGFLPDYLGDASYVTMLLREEGTMKNNGTGEDIEFSAPVYLPDGATVTAAVVYGDFAGNDWWLYRAPINDPTNLTEMATGALGTEDTTITQPLVDNSAYRYFLMVLLSNNKKIIAARIKYTV